MNPAAAAAVGAVGAIGPAQPVSCFYRDYFSDAANDPFWGDYTQVLSPYGVPLANQNILSPAEVQQLALSGQTQRVPSVFLLQLQDGKLYIFLQLARFDAHMGLPATPWDNLLYVQKGELFHNQAQLVAWHSSYFHQANASLRVQTSAAIDTSFAGDPAAVMACPSLTRIFLPQQKSSSLPSVGKHNVSLPHFPPTSGWEIAYLFAACSLRHPHGPPGDTMG